MKKKILTEEIINKGKSKNGGWSLKQLELLGISSFKRGWKKETIGKEFDEKTINEFLSLKNKHLDNTVIKTYSEKLKPNSNLPIDKQYNHPKWLDLKKDILKRDNYRCQKCKRANGELHVHHIKYELNKFVWEIEKEFLIVLCRNCHEEIHDRKFNLA